MCNHNLLKIQTQLVFSDQFSNGYIKYSADYQDYSETIERLMK